jgi:hypothetical protein
VDPTQRVLAALANAPDEEALALALPATGLPPNFVTPLWAASRAARPILEALALRPATVDLTVRFGDGPEVSFSVD